MFVGTGSQVLLDGETLKRRLHILSEHRNAAESLYKRVSSVLPVVVKNSKEHLQLEEELTALLLRVDSVETSGHIDIRTARKDIVHIIQSALTLLDQ